MKKNTLFFSGIVLDHVDATLSMVMHLLEITQPTPGSSHTIMCVNCVNPIGQVENLISVFKLTQLWFAKRFFH